MPRTLLLRLTALGIFGARVAQADVPSLALDRLQPAPAGDPMLSIESPAAKPARLSLSALGSYAKSPLVLRQPANDQRDKVVDYQLVAHVDASFSVASRAVVDVDLPVVASQSGTTRSAGGLSATAPDGGTVGDARVGARVVVLRQERAVPAVALSNRLFLPTGKSASYASTGHVRYAPAVVVGADHGGWLWSLSLGRTFRGADATRAKISGSSIDGGAGAAVRVGPVQVGAEVFGSTVSDAFTDAFARTTTNAEALLVARWQSGGFHATAAAGPGLGHGIGTPAYRAVLAVGYSADFATGSASQGGSASGSVSSSSGVASGTLAIGTAKKPDVPQDTDGDGILDADDACPNVIGVAATKRERNGCPKDTDEDGIVDAIDACPTVPGVTSDDPKANGCPADSDSDGIPDPTDACPREKGPATTDPKTNGCPTSVRVEGQQIVILQQVQFETGKDVIKEESFGLLGQVASVMVEHPDIVRLAVDGHTDDVGSEKNNVQLSQRRAVAVLRWLVDHKVDARRVEARGFGPRRPIADNKTPEGKAKNRRVEFQIRKRDPRGERAWQDGPVE